jgi:hypothetical protein
LKNSKGKVLSLYRNRSIVYGGTAKIHKLFVSDFEYSKGENGTVTMFYGPTPDHYLKPVFENFELKVTIEDMKANRLIYSKSERVSEIGRNYEKDFFEREFSFTSENDMGLFRVCGTIEKSGTLHEEYCFVVDASKFVKKEVFSEIGAVTTYLDTEKRLDIEFYFIDPSISDQVDATFILMDFSTNNLLSEGELNSLPQSENVKDIPTGNYTLIINNFLTKSQTKIDIVVGNPVGILEAQSCSQLGGYSCTVNQTCFGTLINANDGGVCCSETCGQKITPIPGLPSAQSFQIDNIVVFFVIILLVIGVLVKLMGKKEDEFEGYNE